MNQKFTSYDRSQIASLDYAVNRSYSSGQGRFTSVDPIGMSSASTGNPQSNNLYAYVGNNPIDFVDPSGLYWKYVSECSLEVDSWYDGESWNDEYYWDCYEGWEWVDEPTDGGGGGGIVLPPRPQEVDEPPPPLRFKKCEQGKYGKDFNEIQIYLDYLGLSQFIDMNSIRGDLSSKAMEGITFDFKNAKGAEEYITNNPDKFKNANMGSAHNEIVSGGKVKVDGRSRQGNSKSGLPRKSLQFDIGSSPSDPNSPVTGYADLDCDNPGQNPWLFIKHATKIVGPGEY